MKKASKFITAAVLVLATIGAFAASKKQTLSQVFVQSGATCVQKWAEVCPQLNGTCLKDTYNTNDLGDPFQPAVQIYQSRLNNATCQIPYRSN